ncbi:MAG: hypothetical protein KAU48_04225, partial [Candidatus Thorarchaeota archaeon]|nr:hypothetical protein [Candidatus Thorarchaeota archaeon]
MMKRPHYYILVIIFCFILGNSLATVPTIAMNSGNPSATANDNPQLVEDNSESQLSHETTPTRGELVEEIGKTSIIETDIIPPEDPPETTGRNYTMTTPTYSWDDATGGDFYYLDDDSSMYLPLPFEFEYYGQSYWDLYFTSNGKISFTDMDSSPTGTYPSGASEDWYSIALFWADLAPVGNIYTEYFTAPSRLVIQFDSIDYSAGGLAGTFQLVLFEWGDIEFRYDHLQNMADYTVGLNYGANTTFFNTYTFSGDPIDDLALRFEYVSRFVCTTSESYSSSSDYTITWTARSDETIDDFHIYVDSTYNGSTSLMTYPLSGLAEGWVSLEIWMETDGTNVTHQKDIIVDWTSPTVSIEYPLNDTTLADGKVNWSVYELMSLDRIEVLIDHVLYSTLDFWDTETYILADVGQWHNITIVAYDEAMNFGSDNVTIYYDRTVAAVGIVTSHGENDLWGVRDLYLSLGHIVVTMDERLTTYDLDLFDVIFIASPSGSDVLWPSSETTVLETYLSNGGILVTVGDYWLSSSVKTILEPYGIEFTEEVSWPWDNTTNFDASHPLMTGVSSLFLPSLDNKFEISCPACELFGTEDGSAAFGVVADLAETRILSLCYGFDFFIDMEDNRLLWENILDYWLTVDTHDLRACVGVPDALGIATTVMMDVHVINNGLSTETSFTLQIWVEGSLKGSMVVASLASGDWAILSVPLFISYTGSINVTAYVTPVIGEINLANNIRTKIVDIYQFTILAPGDLDSIQGGLVWINYTCTNWGGLENITGI